MEENDAGGVAAGDYNDDGWVDLFIVRGDIGPNLLDRNKGDGTFEDVTVGSGLEPMNARYTLSSAFGDYDLDGDLDMFLGHWGTPRNKMHDQLPWPRTTENLWRNDTGPDGVIQFTDVSLPAGISESIVDDDPQESFGDPDDYDYTFSPTFARITNDRYPDLVISSDVRTSRYYTNDGAGTFTDATDRDVIIDRNGMGSALGDYDGDGDLDWFVSSIWTDPEIRTERFFTVGNRLYRNDGGEFADVTVEAGVRDGGWGWGSCFADFDNDGDLDLYHTNGWPHVDDFTAYNFDTDTSRLFISDGEGVLTELSQEAGIVDNERGHGIVCGDFDNDGDVDIFQMHRNETNAGTLWRNDLSENNYLRVKLNGRAPNTAAAGARITLTINGENQLREIMIGSNFTSQNPLVQVFGLGSSAQADLTVEWPDGQTSSMDNVDANQLIPFEHPDN